MGVVTVLGCLLVAFGPLTAFFTFVLSKRATLVLLAVGSCFAWLFGLIVASIFWSVLGSGRAWTALAALLGVLATEAARFFFWLVWSRGRVALSQAAGRRVGDEAALVWESVAAGTGFAFGSALPFSGLLWSAWGPGVLAAECCGGVSVFFVGALLALGGGVLQVLWSVVAHRAFERRSWMQYGIVMGSHLLVSATSLLNTGQLGVATGLCAVPFVTMMVLIALLSLYVRRMIHGVKL